MATRVIFFLADDLRWDDIKWTTFEAGPRNTELVFQQLNDRLLASGCEFTRARGDMSVCQPARTAILSGNQRPNHGVNDISENAYYKHTRQGLKDTQVWSGVRQWEGPWEEDLALQAGLATTPDLASTQPLGGISNFKRTNNQARGDAADDLQAFTGGYPTWLANDGVKCFAVGKYMNAYASISGPSPYNVADPTGDYWSAATTYTSGQRVAYLGRFYTSSQNGNINHIPSSSPTFWTAGNIPLTTRYVPPGWSHWKVIDNDGQDHFHMTTNDFDVSVGGVNPASGRGQIANKSSYDYDWPISAVSWAAGVATITLTSVPSTIVNGVTVAAPVETGDEVAVDGVTTATGYNFPYKTATKISNTQFTVPMAVNPGAGAGLGSAFCYPRALYPHHVLKDDFLAYMDTLTDSDDFLGYFGCQLPHSSTTAVGGDSVQNEKRYDHSTGRTVNNNQAYRWQGFYGAHSPAMITSPSESDSVAHRTNWVQRAEMCGTADDIIGDILDYCEARWGTDFTFVFASDNGFQTGDHAATEGTDSWSFQGGKIYIWESSLRLPLIIRGPDFPQPVYHRNVQLADIPLTFLDLFGLVNHHAHTKRDGRSILREIADPQDRSILCTGKYLANVWTGSAPQSNTNQGIIDASSGDPDDPGWKLVRRWDDHTARELVKAFDFAEYETVDHEFDDVDTQALAETLAGKCDRAMTARWQPIANRHTKDDIEGTTPSEITGTMAGVGGGAGASTGQQVTIASGLGAGAGGGTGSVTGVTTRLGVAAGVGGGAGVIVADADPYEKVAVLDADQFAVLDF